MCVSAVAFLLVLVSHSPCANHKVGFQADRRRWDNAVGARHKNWRGRPCHNSLHVRQDGIRQIYFQDPDGHWIEINDAAEDA